MREGRRYFRQQLQELEEEIQAMAVSAERLFEVSIRALSAQNPALYQTVVSGDDAVDAYYLSIERRIVALFALQSPVVASDLRFLTAMLHINGHLERVADMAVNIAKIGESAKGLPRAPNMLQNLEEMSGIAIGMLEAAMDALARRDLVLSRELPSMDKPIDDLNRGMMAEVLAAAGSLDTLQWCVAMHLVSRQVERVGDHAVDIGEQVAYLVTGDFQEFTDASHPEIEQPHLASSPDHPPVTNTG
jgi:phosphate transport system protein